MSNELKRKIVLAACRYLEDIIPFGQRIEHLRLEKICKAEEQEDVSFWEIVLSYDDIKEFYLTNVRIDKEFLVAVYLDDNEKEKEIKVLSMSNYEPKMP